MKGVFLLISMLFFYSQNCICQTQRCPAYPPATNVMAKKISSNQSLFQSSSTLTYNISIPVVFHVIYSSNGTGNISETQIQDQMTKINNCFSGTGFSFYLFGVTSTQNDTWHNAAYGSQGVLDMADALSIDPKHVLNVYVKNTGPHYGWVISYPIWSIPETSKRNVIIIDYGSVPNGYITNFNLGTTLVHETGHWLCLYHTYEGACDDLDYIWDTPGAFSRL